jgi:hypothetical protein
MKTGMAPMTFTVMRERHRENQNPDVKKKQTALA